MFHSGCTEVPSYQQCTGVPSFPTSSPTLVISGLFDNNHSNREEVIPHGGLDLHVLLKEELGIGKLSSVQSHCSVLGWEGLKGD